MTTATGTTAGGAPAGGSGLAPNIASLCCYLLMAVTCGVPVAGLVFLAIEKSNGDVRFHAWQSILLGGGLWVAWLILNGVRALVPFVGVVASLCSLILSFVGLGAWVICMIKAYQGERWRIPYVGDIAAKQAGV